MRKINSVSVCNSRKQTERYGSAEVTGWLCPSSVKRNIRRYCNQPLVSTPTYMGTYMTDTCTYMNMYECTHILHIKNKAESKIFLQARDG